MRSTKYIYRGLKILLLSLLSLLYACSSEKVEELIENIDTLEEEIVEEIPVTEIEEPTPINSSSMFPASDPNNTGDWVLNTDISDEFEDSVLDETKWLVQGRNDEFKSNFKGRAPSQFSTDNFRMENGRLILETRWEPDYDFNPKMDSNGEPYENLTTAAVITRKEFLYGYMEAKIKAADAEITSSFWATGGKTEFDFVEIFGDHRQANKERANRDNELWWSIHDWSIPGGPTTYTERHILNGANNTPNIRWASGFNVIGFDWSPDGIKIYLNGVLFRDLTRSQIDDFDDSSLDKGGNGIKENFVVTKPIAIWFDQETFPWHGVPDSKEDLERNSPVGKKDDGVVDFEIEYLRVWQKK